MSRGLTATASRDLLGVWCGWVLIGAAVLVAPIGWLWPLGFSALLALVGLLCLPAVRISDQDRPAAMILFAGLIWAAVSTTWSPYHPSKPGNNTILKLAFELPLYWSAISAARRADPALRTRALQVLAFGCALFGLVLIEETVTRGAAYKYLHVFYEPIRGDLAESNDGHSTQVLGLIWPLAALGAPSRLMPWLALVMAAGVGAAAMAFGYDAPVLGLILAPVVFLMVWRWPTLTPRLLAVVAAVLFLSMPAVIWTVRHFTDYEALRRALPMTDAMRLGYWSHAIDWIKLRPIQGWGLEASRMFGPGIVLHPHNNPLQVWLELGAIGAITAAAFWGVVLSRLARPWSNMAAAASAACCSVYLLYGVNFGVWQEWWLALGALVALLTVANAQRPVR